MAGGAFVVEVSAAVETIELPHRCGDGTNTPVPVTLGDAGRARLADGEALPATARCRRCGGRVFASLVDPDARARRRAEARPDPTALRRPTNVRRFPSATPRRDARSAEAPPGEPCPACGAVPDSFGLCRCSL